MHYDGKCVQFNNPGPKYWGPLKKNLLAKNMQNLVRFCTTSNFDDECLQKGKIFKIGQLDDLSQFFPRSLKKSLVNFGPITMDI